MSNSSRLSADTKIKNFGDGSLGDIVNIITQLNNYATVTAISGDKVTYTNKTTTGLVQIAAGALVMLHYNYKSGTNTADAGRFIVAKVTNDTGTILTLDVTPPAIECKNYYVQVVSIPQANNFTLSTTNSATPAFNNKCGGIFAIAVQNNCNLSGGIIDVEKKGYGTAYLTTGLKVIGNAQMCNRLPIGQGHGSVFILAKNLTMNASTRIGAAYSGAGFGGYSSGTKNVITTLKGGYKGDTGTSTNINPASGSREGWYNANTDKYGGYGGNASNATNSSYTTGKQGAHIFIVAQTINGFNQAAISTGGEGGKYSTAVNTDGRSGGAGYGGGGQDTATTSTTYSGRGGYNGGGGGNGAGGGGAGWAFIYCNTAVNQNTAGTVYED